jgi:hypothetical protein
MSNLINEAICKRCDEILLNDEAYRRSNDKIVSMESMFKSTLSPEQLAQYNEIEQEIMKASASREVLLYKKGFIDGISVANLK